LRRPAKTENWRKKKNAQVLGCRWKVQAQTSVGNGLNSVGGKTKESGPPSASVGFKKTFRSDGRARPAKLMRGREGGNAGGSKIKTGNLKFVEVKKPNLRKKSKGEMTLAKRPLLKN